MRRVCGGSLSRLTPRTSCAMRLLPDIGQAGFDVFHCLAIHIDVAITRCAGAAAQWCRPGAPNLYPRNVRRAGEIPEYLKGALLTYCFAAAEANNSKRIRRSDSLYCPVPYPLENIRFATMGYPTGAISRQTVSSNLPTQRNKGSCYRAALTNS